MPVWRCLVGQMLRERVGGATAANGGGSPQPRGVEDDDEGDEDYGNADGAGDDYHGQGQQYGGGGGGYGGPGNHGYPGGLDSDLPDMPEVSRLQEPPLHLIFSK